MEFEILIPSLDEWNGAKLPLNGLAIYTNESQMEKGTGIGIFYE